MVDSSILWNCLEKIKKEKIKKSSRKKIYISGNGTFWHPKSLTKLFKIFQPPKNFFILTLDKTSLGEIDCLRNLYYLFAAQASRIHFQNCSLKIVFSKKVIFIALIYSSSEESESSEEICKSSIICLITFFSMHLHSFKNTCA